MTSEPFMDKAEQDDAWMYPELENPKQFLQRKLNSRIEVFLKWGQSYEGELASVDDYFNVLLHNASEKVESCVMGRIGSVLIRCNNIFLIKETKQAPSKT